MKHYNMVHCKNLRDLGGCPTPYGFIPYGVFFRSDAPFELSLEEMEQVYVLGISTVIDLRYEDEILRRPCAFINEDNISYHNISLGVGTLPKTEDEITESYLDFTENKEAMRKIFTILAEAAGAVLFHCTAGKDRTGVIAALLLMTAHANDCDIIADYQVSYTFIRDLINKIKKDNPELPAFAGQSKPEYMERFLMEFQNSYPTIENYLESIQITKAQIIQLKEKLRKID